MGSFFYIMKKYSINRWSEVFENADSRKRQRLGLYYMPSGCDSSGYLGLMSEFEPAEAWQAYGIFVALCQHTATMTKDVRGTFQNTDGTAMTTRRLALIVRADLGILERSLEILMDERVGWVSATDVPAICQQPASDVPQNSGFVQGEGEGEGEGEDNTTASDDAERVWQSYPKKSDKPMGIKAIIKALKTYTADELIRRVEYYAQNNTEVKYQKGGGRWFRDKRYEDEVKPTPQQSALPKSLPNPRAY